MRIKKSMREAVFNFLRPEIDGLVVDRLNLFWTANFAEAYAKTRRLKRSSVEGTPLPDHEQRAFVPAPPQGLDAIK